MYGGSVSKSGFAKLHHICLSIKYLKASLAFYDQVMPLMGWNKRRSEKSTAYSNGEYEIYLEEAKQQNRPFHRYGIGLQHMAFNAPSREAVDHFYQALQDIGATVTDPPKEYPQYHEHYYAVFFKDPSGIPLEFCFVPGFEF